MRSRILALALVLAACTEPKIPSVSYRLTAIDEQALPWTTEHNARIAAGELAVRADSLWTVTVTADTYRQEEAGRMAAIEANRLAFQDSAGNTLYIGTHPDDSTFLLKNVSLPQMTWRYVRR